MDYIDISGDITCAGSEAVFDLVLQEKFCKPAAAMGLSVKLAKLPKEQLMSGEGFIWLPSWFNFYFPESVVNKLFSGSPVLIDQLMLLFGELFEMTGNSIDPDGPHNIRSATYSFHCLFEDGKALRFQLPAIPRDDLEKRTKALFQWLKAYMGCGQESIETERAACYSFDGSQYYLSYEGNGWRFVDPLYESAQQIRREYFSARDPRLHKPDIILQEDNLSRRHTFPDNWILRADGLSTMMQRPNDVSLYASICERHLKVARDFYDRTFPNRHHYGIGHFPIAEQQLEYHDYFEEITTALLFSYTAIEAFVNSFIPDAYQVTKPSGKVIDKQRIERTYPLVQKLTEVMTDIYATPDPRQAAWWEKLTALQDVRDQTIHTKQNLSQDRYSRLMSAEIFATVAVYREIITWYGAYILKKDKYLINDYPVGFGYDDIYPALMSERTYRDIYNSLHNPSKPL